MVYINNIGEVIFDGRILFYNYVKGKLLLDFLVLFLIDIFVLVVFVDE